MTLNNANAATASFVVPATSKSGDSFQFTLTITDAKGETDSVPISVFALADLTQPFLYYRAQQVPTVGQEPEDATFESSVSGTISTTLDTTLNIFRFAFTPSASGSEMSCSFSPETAPSRPVPIRAATRRAGTHSLSSLTVSAPRARCSASRFTRQPQLLTGRPRSFRLISR